MIESHSDATDWVNTNFIHLIYHTHTPLDTSRAPEFSILLKDTSARGLEELGIDPQPSD